jgi:hypothetical protein
LLLPRSINTIEVVVIAFYHLDIVEIFVSLFLCARTAWCTTRRASTKSFVDILYRIVYDSMITVENNRQQSLTRLWWWRFLLLKLVVMVLCCIRFNRHHHNIADLQIICTQNPTIAKQLKKSRFLRYLFVVAACGRYLRPVVQRVGLIPPAPATVGPSPATVIAPVSVPISSPHIKTLSITQSQAAHSLLVCNHFVLRRARTVTTWQKPTSQAR